MNLFINFFIGFLNKNIFVIGSSKVIYDLSLGYDIFLGYWIVLDVIV